MACAVSVVVPVFNPGRHIEDLIASLRRQTIPPTQFETIFVDDGSTDGTGERLDRLEAEDENVRVIHIPNSGWPSRPRNIGIEAARGEYVYFVDNDDELGEEALERLYAYARENDADVVVGKEVRLYGGWVVGADLFTRDRPTARLFEDPLLETLTPHKLFRRSFLLAHGIRFPERKDVLEDHAFVTQTYLNANKISVLSNYTCYYWKRRRDRTNVGASSYGRDFRDALDVIERESLSPEFRDRLLANWYRKKVLGRFNEQWAALAPEAAERAFDARRKFTEERFPAQIDPYLPGFARVRSALLRDGKLDEMRALARLQEGMFVDQGLDSLVVSEASVALGLSATVRYADGSPVVLEPAHGDYVWPAPPQLGSLPEGARRFGAEPSTPRLLVRSRSTREAFVVPMAPKPLKSTSTGELPLGALATGSLDLGEWLGGRVGRDTWDVELELEAHGWSGRSRLRAPVSVRPRGCFGAVHFGGRLVVPFATRAKTVALDIDQSTVSILGETPPDASGARLVAAGAELRLSVPVPGLELAGEPVLGTLRLAAPLHGEVTEPLRLVPGADGVGGSLVCDLRLARWPGRRGLLPGRWRLSAVFHDRDEPLGLVLGVGFLGTVVLRDVRHRTIARVQTSDLLQGLSSRVALGRRRERSRRSTREDGVRS